MSVSANADERLRYQCQQQGSFVNNIIGPILASATTIAITHGIHHVSGTVEITTITPPFPDFQGQITLIPDAAFTLATGGNVAEASTADANQAMTLFYDGALWYPSY